MQELLLIAVFDIDGLVHHVLVPPGQGVTGHFYMQVLQRLADAVQKKLRNKWQGQWFLHHDKHQATHCLLCSNSSPSKTSLSSPNHRTFGCSVL
jgi:hypothetical protein